LQIRTVHSLFLALGFAGILVGCSASVPEGQESIATGWITAGRIVSSEFPGFRARYDTVTVNEDLTAMITRLADSLEAVVFLGTWCGDSRREVPHFMRIAEKSRIPSDRIRYYGLDRTKKSPDGLTDTYSIERVPTFIFLMKGDEIGRIVELPRSTLEGDLFEILVAHSKIAGQADR
jgi:thiol-disulfide isomerase/thioredoxin